MKQILQSFKTGEMWLADVPAPLCRNNGILMKNSVSFVSSGTERMLVDFAKRSLVGKAMKMPDQVKKVLRKIKTEGLFATLEKVQSKLDQPIPLGYSCAGTVEEAGIYTEGFATGDRVACGGVGFANHAEFNYVPKNLVVKIPENVSFEDASCATVGSIAMQGIRQCDLRLGESLCIIGLGLLGMLALQMAKASGCKVIGFDPNQSRCKLALELGADNAVSEGLLSAAMGLSDGHGVDAVLITAATPSNEPITVAAEIAKMKGKVVATGLVGLNIPRDLYYKKELDFRLSMSYGPGRYDPVYEDGGIDYPYGYVRWTEQRNMKAFVDLVAMGKISPSKLITHRFNFEDSLDAYKLLLGQTHEPYMGIVLDYPESQNIKPISKIEISTPKPNALKSAPSVSFIGFGNFTKSVLIPNLKKLSGYNMRGLCTESGMNCGVSAKKFGFEFATTKHADVIEDSQTNLVFVTTRHNTHAQLAAEALKSNKNVFTEKPLAINEEQLAKLECAEKESSAFLMAGFNRRFSPHATLIKDYFKNRTTPLFMLYRVNAGIIPKNIWLQNPEIGGGRIIGECCHFIDFMAYISGAKVIEVSASSIKTNDTSIAEEDSVNISLKFSDGSLGSLLYGALGDTSLPKEYCEILGEESTAVMDNFNTTKCTGKLGKRKLSGTQKKGFYEELDCVLKSIQNATGAPIPAESLFNTTRATFAALKSLKSGHSENVK